MNWKLLWAKVAAGVHGMFRLHSTFEIAYMGRTAYIGCDHCSKVFYNRYF